MKNIIFFIPYNYLNLLGSQSGISHLLVMSLGQCSDHESFIERIDIT